jgi:DNA polymerase III sliding clamp (beta) subunit (PCNA family)
MKLTTKTKPLIDALKVASAAMAGPRTLPVLTCALIECEPGNLKITCDSIDARLTVTIPCDGVAFTGSFLAPPRLLTSALRGEDAVIEVKDRRLHIDSCGKTTLSTLPLEEFPHAWMEIEAHEVSAPDFLTSMVRAAHCVGVNTGDNRECLQWHKDTKCLVGTNGTTISISPLELPFSEPFLLHSSQARVITSTFGVSDALKVGRSGHTLLVECENRKAWVKLREGNVGNYTLLVPEMDTAALIERDHLEHALGKLADFTESDYPRVTMEPNGESWTVSAMNASGKSSMDLSVEVVKQLPAEPFTVNRTGLLNLIKNWHCDRLCITKTHNMIMLYPERDSGLFGMSVLFVKADV